MITLEPVAGLANRMRAIDSVIVLGREIERRARIVWIPTTDLNCRFHDLFETHEGLPVVERSFLRNRVVKRLAITTRHYRSVLHDAEVERRIQAGETFTDLADHDRCLIVTCRRFRTRAAPFRELVPVEPIRREVDAVTSSFSPHTVGVHVRRTDHLPAIRESPLDAFVRHMRDALAKERATDFFLSTDCAS